MTALLCEEKEENVDIISEILDTFDGQKIAETSVGEVETPLAELCTIERTKQLKKLPMMSTGSVEGDMSVRPVQQTETRRSQNGKVVSMTGGFNLRVDQVPTHPSSFLTKENKAEERKSFVPEDTASHQFYSCQFQEPEPTQESDRREMTDTEGRLLTPNHYTRLTSPQESHRSEGRKRPDNSGLSPLMISATWFNKSAETQRSDRRQMPLNTKHALRISNRQGTQKSDGKNVFADCELHYSASSNAIICKPEETQESEAEQKLVADELHPSMSSQLQETDTGGNRQRRMSDASHCASSGPPPFGKTGGSAVTDQRRHFASSFFRRADELPLFLLLFAVWVCTVAGNLCKEKREILVVQKGEVALVCPVTADVHQTKQTVVISFVNNHTHEEVLGCDWLKRLNKFDCLKSEYGAELIEIQADCVLARLPEDRVQQNGSYRAQMIPNDPNQPFTYCNLCYPVVPKDTSTTEVPTTVDHHMRESQKDTGGDEKQTTITVLFCAVFFLLGILVVIVFFHLQKRGMCRITLDGCCVKKRVPGTPVNQITQTGSLYKQAAQDHNLMISDSDFASQLA